MTPAEANQARRGEAIRRSHRIDALAAGQLLNFIHRMAAIVPADVDRVLAEFDANAPKPRTERKLHPVTFYGNCDMSGGLSGLVAYCTLDPGWLAMLEDGQDLAELERLVRDHSRVES